MGGGSYSQDVAAELRSSSNDAFSQQAYHSSDASGVSKRTTHPKLNPFKTRREVNNATPIVVALDVTRSRGDDTKLMWDKLPLLMGQIELKGYVDNPGISICAIGDATVDAAPLQVSQFEGDNRIDENIARVFIEEGGGGTGQESYELAAYYYSRTNCVRLAKGVGKKGYFFFVGDEGFYPQVSKAHVEKIIGDELPGDLDTHEAFRRLHEKFDVFFIYPAKSFEARKSDIDAEIKQRVLAAGGMYENVAIRASLVWGNRNDLDLHVIAPSGEHVYFSHKRSACHGELDVDRNIQGETTKPVENVRWPKGMAPKGRYQVFVENYRFHEADHAPTEFKLELEVDGEIQHFTHVISPKGQTGGESRVMVADFVYDPDAKAHVPPGGKQDAYDNYSDDVILAQWSSVIPREHILRIEDPKAIVDVILGALAIREGTATLDKFLGDLKARESTDARTAQVSRALSSLSSRKNVGAVEGNVPPPSAPQTTRSKRL